jgi:hypothetical protein
LRAFLDLPATDRILLLQAIATVVAIRLALMLLPFERTRRILARFARPALKPRHLALDVPERVVWAVTTASQVLPGDAASCLVKALTAQLLLGRRGFSTQLHIGFAKDKQGAVEGHAWLEWQGRIVIGDNVDLARFTPLASLNRY